MLLKSDQGVFVAGLALALAGTLATVFGTIWLNDLENERQRAALAEQAEQATGLVSARLMQVETLVNAGRSLFAGSPIVSRSEWADFANAFLARQRIIGLVGLGWVPRVDAEGLAELDARQRADGLGPLEVRPAGEREVYCPVFYNEPAERNPQSIGRDACQVNALREALSHARSGSEARLSEPLRLIFADGSELAGYVMLLAIDGQEPLASGWVSASLNARRLFDLSDVVPEPARVRLHDESAVDRPVFGDPAPTRRDGPALLAMERRFQAGGRDWLLTIEQPARQTLAPWLLLATGLTITALLVLLLVTLLRTRLRAMHLAERMTRAYRESEQLLTSVTNNIFEGIYRGKPNEGLVYANQALAKMFRFDTPEAMIDHAGPMLYADPDQRDELLSMMQRDGYYRDVEVEFIRPDGSRFVGVNNAVAIKDEQGEIRYFDGAIYDITDRKRAEEQVHHLAHYDALTGLPNRTHLDQYLQESIVKARRRHQPLAVLFMDLDHFKNINDSLGHGMGDRLLAAIARRLEDGLRGNDLVCRQGGDEFLVIMTNTDRAGACQGARRVLELLVEPFLIAGNELRVAPSIGIALFPEHGDSPEALVANADAAMYYAKELGRGNHQFFTPELNERAHQRLRLEGELRQAITGEQFEVYYQPIVDLTEFRIQGAEALLRWNHPERGLVGPDEFIPVAEQSGLIVSLGDWVIDQACRQLAAWSRANRPPVRVAVNVSAVQFWRGNLVECVKHALDSHGVDPRWLELELTESVIMHDVDLASRVIAELNELGVGLTIDDFGTGYSSLAYLKRLHIRKLKIDQSFIQDIATDPDDAAIVEAIISLAAALNLQVVAEGVETTDQLERLRAGGCRIAQGFLFGHPVPAAGFYRDDDPATRSPAGPGR